MTRRVAGLVSSWQGIAERRENRQVAAELPFFLEELARAVRSGLTVSAGIAAAGAQVDGPLRSDLDVLNARLDRGMSLSDALGRWADTRRRLPSVRMVTAAVVLAASAGGSIGTAIDSVAETIRDEIALEAEVGALAAQAKASAVLVALLPLVFGVIGAMADPRSLTFMFQSRLGHVCLVLGLGLDLGGWLWMRGITGRDVR